MKKQYVTLSEKDRTYLENLISKGSLPAKTYKRALALLELDRGSTFKNVARIVGVTHQTASTWAQKYGECGDIFPPYIRISLLNDQKTSHESLISAVLTQN